ncbi:hypothetical protein GIB67_016820, partial [Kingdonia uniflora]
TVYLLSHEIFVVDYAQEQEMEIEALEAILADEFEEINCNDSGLGTTNRCFQITMSPQDDDVDESTTLPVLLGLVFSHTEKYPDEPPLLNVKSLRGIQPEDLKILKNKLEQEASENLGMAMVYTLVSSAKEWLGEIFSQDVGIEDSEVEETPKDEIVVPHGEAVTVETFLAWRERYEAELALERAKLMPESALASTKEKKLSGRQWFESGRASAKGAAAAEGSEDEADEDIIDFDEEDFEGMNGVQLYTIVHFGGDIVRPKIRSIVTYAGGSAKLTSLRAYSSYKDFATLLEETSKIRCEDWLSTTKDTGSGRVLSTTKAGGPLRHNSFPDPKPEYRGYPETNSRGLDPRRFEPFVDNENDSFETICTDVPPSNKPSIPQSNVHLSNEPVLTNVPQSNEPFQTIPTNVPLSNEPFIPQSSIHLSNESVLTNVPPSNEPMLTNVLFSIEPESIIGQSETSGKFVEFVICMLCFIISYSISIMLSIIFLICSTEFRFEPQSEQVKDFLDFQFKSAAYTEHPYDFSKEFNIGDLYRELKNHIRA